MLHTQSEPNGHNIIGQQRRRLTRTWSYFESPVLLSDSPSNLPDLMEDLYLLLIHYIFICLSTCTDLWNRLSRLLDNQWIPACMSCYNNMYHQPHIDQCRVKITYIFIWIQILSPKFKMVLQPGIGNKKTHLEIVLLLDSSCKKNV